MESIKASSKGQMIIPKAIREALDIRSGTDLNVELDSATGFRVTVAPTDRCPLVLFHATPCATTTRFTPASPPTTVGNVRVFKVPSPTWP